MAVTITETGRAACGAVFLRGGGKGVAVRLGVRTTGCSGLAYKMEYADQIDPG